MSKYNCRETPVHWIIKNGDLIVEEHCVDMHGNFHIVYEYLKGVTKPQINIDDEAKDKNVELKLSVYWANGKIMIKVGMKDYIPNGIYKWYYPNGILGKEGEWKDQKPFGIWKVYNPKGESIAQGAYKNGKRQSGSFIGDELSNGFIFFENEPKIETYKDGKMIKEENIKIEF